MKVAGQGAQEYKLIGYSAGPGESVFRTVQHPFGTAVSLDSWGCLITHCTERTANIARSNQL